MTYKPTLIEKKYATTLHHNFSLMMDDLKSKGQINLNHVKQMDKMKRMFNFANQSILHINEWDGIVRIPNERKQFEKLNKNLKSDILDEIWFDLLVISTLRNYWAIEMSLITLLKDVQYGKKEIVQGKENLGKLKKILDGMGYQKHIPWNDIDITFRNALAHGWYYRKKQNFVFYHNAKLTHGKNFTTKKLLHKCRIVQINSVVISGLVGDWKNKRNLGSKDPLRSKKK